MKRIWTTRKDNNLRTVWVSENIACIQNVAKTTKKFCCVNNIRQMKTHRIVHTYKFFASNFELQLNALLIHLDLVYCHARPACNLNCKQTTATSKKNWTNFSLLLFMTPMCVTDIVAVFIHQCYFELVLCYANR